MKYWAYVLVAILFSTALLVLGATYYSSKKKEETALSNEVLSEISKLESYVNENKGISTASVAIVNYDYMENYSHNNPIVVDEIKAVAEENIIYALEVFLDGEFIAVETIEGVEHIIEEPYISDELKQVFEEQKKVSIDRREYNVNLLNSDDEILESNANRIEVGYSESQVVEKIGRPNDITTSTSAYGVSKMFEYEDKFIYFKDGVVTRVVDF